MKTLSSSKTFILCVTAAATAVSSSCAQQGSGRGMPPEVREQIHALFDNHEKIRRTVKLTADGYSAVTESDDPKVATGLKKHVGQMQKRLESGLSARRWDPAFAEYSRHYSDLEHEFTPTEKGVRMTVKGRTPAAVKAAQNHAKVLSAFVAHGWSEHDEQHPAASR